MRHLKQVLSLFIPWVCFVFVFVYVFFLLLGFFLVVFSRFFFSKFCLIFFIISMSTLINFSMIVSKHLKHIVLISMLVLLCCYETLKTGVIFYFCVAMKCLKHAVVFISMLL